jgi:uncharacterized protein (DUF302 family)
MNLSDVAQDANLVTMRSAHGANKTVDRLKFLLDQKHIHVFAHIDHADAAKKMGLYLRPTHVVIFGNPRAGTPLMQARQTIGLDLPLRILIWEDASGTVWLTYRQSGVLARDHHLADHDQVIKALDDGLSTLARAATSTE